MNSWDKSYSDLFKKLDLEAEINSQSIIETIKRTQTTTVTRNNLVRVLKAVCNLVEFKFDRLQAYQPVHAGGNFSWGEFTKNLVRVPQNEKVVDAIASKYGGRGRE